MAFHRSRAPVRCAPIAAVAVALACGAACQPREAPRDELVASVAAPTAPTAPTAAPTTPIALEAPTATAAAQARVPTASSSEEQPAACATLRDVTVSDVVRVDGTTLFYAEASEGLTIVDVSDPAAPRTMARVPFVGTPTALFVHEGIAWVVFVDSDARFLEAKIATVIRAIDVRTPEAPRVIGQEVREGSATIAKLVDGSLYTLRAGPSGGSVVESFEVLRGALHALDQVALEGSPAQLAASSAGLAAVTLTGEGAEVAWIDLALQRGGAIGLREAVRLPGGVATWERGEGRIVDADEGQRVRLVTCATRACGPAEAATLRTVDFRGPGPARVLAPLRLTERGGLPLTRFAEELLYVAETSRARRDATTLRVARTEEAGPRFVGHLALRGMLSGIVPRDGSVVALGTVGGPDAPVHIIVHDVDVRRPEAPRVRASVTFGSDWTWSPALDDDKALSFDPATHLVAVPFTAWRHADKRYVTGTQLVELGANGGQPFSTVHAEGLVERALFVDGQLVTIGPAGVVAVDYAARRRADLVERGLDLEERAKAPAQSP
jgi:hypothetical protein